MYRHLRDFLAALEREGELLRVTETVSPYLEISKFTDRESKRPGGGKALLFENVKGSAFPVAVNIFGSMKRMCMALGVKDLDEPGRRIREFIDFHPPRNLREALEVVPRAVAVSRFFPRTFKGKTPPCQEVVLTGDQVDLSKLPVLHCWPQDGGPFITLPLVVTRSLETGKRNVGMYRMQVFDRNTTGMHWHIHKDGSHYYNEYRRRGLRMPVAVAIGADPAVTYAATAPLPRGVDEMMLAGFIRKRPVVMAPCVTVDLMVPAEAEFVLEGYVDPEERRMEGPFGDHTGYYSLADLYPVFHVTAVTHRRNPIYNATLVGRPPMEDCYLAKATERMFLPMLQTVFPEIVDYWLPWEGVFHNIVVVALDKEYPGHAQKIMSGLWGQGQMSFCKAIIVTDRSVDLTNPAGIIDALLTRLDITTDITLTQGVLDVLDHSSPFPNFGNKIGLDLTARFPGEPPRQSRGAAIPTADHAARAREAAMNIPGVAGVRALFPERSKDAVLNRILAVSAVKSADRGGKAFAADILDRPELAAFNIVVLFDPGIDLFDGSLMLWKIFNNVDPGRDMVRRGCRVVVDACKKGPMDGHDREWPDELTFDE
ncbi:menaquinone biosynthesis decarboxylase [Desulfococcus sp.]|uniref:menaquinone biosynthesis decarboxylase n=1 Tax=Desulfococcus sp. TaxID=2025834 RepID=UPI003D0E2CBA